MKRRPFLQALFGLPSLAFVPRPAAAPELRAGLVYSDSIGTPPAALKVLKDENTASGGINYPA